MIAADDAVILLPYSWVYAPLQYNVIFIHNRKPFFNLLLVSADGKNIRLEEPLPWERRNEGQFYNTETAFGRLTEHLRHCSIKKNRLHQTFEPYS